MIKNIGPRLLNKSIRVAREIKFRAGFYSPVNQGNNIIMYHGVDKFGDKKFNLRHVGVADFERQIKYFKKFYNVVSLEEYWAGNFDNDKITIAITFDDGYLNNFKYALPVIEKYEVPVSFFITGLNPAEHKILWPDFIEIAATLTDKNIVVDGESFIKTPRKWLRESDQKSLHNVIKENGSFNYKQSVFSSIEKLIPDFTKDAVFDDHWKLMSDEEITEASMSKFISIGSHGYFHNNLGNIPLNDAITELINSKNYLENLIQKPVNSIAYPDGSYSRELIGEAEKVGLKYQLATDYYLFDEDKNDKRIKTRFGVYPVDSSANIIHEFETHLNLAK